MRKYLELFKDGFDSTIAEKTEVKNWPYVGYSPSEGVVFTVIPEPYFGPADNEIWYTNIYGNAIWPGGGFGANIVSDKYNDNHGVITFDGPVTSIGDGAFSDCSSLTSVTIPESVTSIGFDAFGGCSSLTSVNIPNSVTSIGKQAFSSCRGLTSITIPNSVTSIGFDAFYGCKGLTKTNYTGDIAGWCNINFIDASSNPVCYSKNFYINDQEIKDLVIPNSVTSIGNCAFYGCKGLTSITIPDSVTSIGEKAFSGCSSLTSITFEGTMEEWNSITKGASWNYKVTATYVQCTDGQVTL